MKKIYNWSLMNGKESVERSWQIMENITEMNRKGSCGLD
jgi:hypothetical protein